MAQFVVLVFLANFSQSLLQKCIRLQQVNIDAQQLEIQGGPWGFGQNLLRRVLGIVRKSKRVQFCVLLNFHVINVWTLSPSRCLHLCKSCTISKARANVHSLKQIQLDQILRTVRLSLHCLTANCVGLISQLISKLQNMNLVHKFVSQKSY